MCLATSGPGGVHRLNGLYDAKCDGQPVLAITVPTFHDLIGTQYQQDVDLDKLFIAVCVYHQRVMGLVHVDNVVDEAIRIALARRGVSHITIPKDIQSWKTDDAERSNANIAKHSADLFAAAYPLKRKAVVHGHCHHKTVLDWNGEQKTLDKMGVEKEVPEDGCCGMAGAFGFRSWRRRTKAPWSSPTLTLPRHCARWCGQASAFSPARL